MEADTPTGPFAHRCGDAADPNDDGVLHPGASEIIGV